VPTDIDRAVLRRRGDDLTLITYGGSLGKTLDAADRLAAEGISAEVIDLRTVAPLDTETILESVARTSRLLIAHEAVVPFGIGAEIAATVAHEAFWNLDAPIERVGAAATPPPYAPVLEHAWLPDGDVIAAAIRRVARA
jgi:2-oxoisovalerate dehydrogenase E1 component